MPTLTRLTPRLPVRDLRRTVALYAEQPGFRAEVLWPEEQPTFAILCRGSTSVGFFEPNDGRPGRIGDAALYFEVADGESLYRALAERSQ